MILSGKNFRSIADQTGDFSYAFTVQTKSKFSDIHVGLTGEYNIDYRFLSGKIFDRNTGFVDSYSNNDNFIISGNLKNHQHEYFINGIPKVVGETVPSGKISGIFAINEEAENIGFNFFGQVPSHSITTSSDKLVFGETLTGFINNSNPDLSFTVFSGELINSDIPAVFAIDTFQQVTGSGITGGAKFLLTPTESETLSGVASLLFHTNFGEINFDYNLTGGNLPTVIRDSSYLDLLTFINDFDGETGSIVVTSFFANYDGAEISVTLGHLSGETGEIFRDKDFTRDFVSTEDTFVSGTNAVPIFKTGLVSGLDASGLLQTGLGSGFLTGFTNATGQIINDFELVLTGLGKGFVDTDINLAGIKDTRFSGFVPFGTSVISGIVNNITGTGTFNEQELTGMIRTGVGQIGFDPLDHLPSGEINLPPSAYNTTLKNKFLAFSGEITGFYDLIGSGFAGFIVETGIFDQNFSGNVKRGVYNFEKEYDTFITGFENLFGPDTVGEIVSGILPETSGSGFYITGNLSVKEDGACIEESPVFSVSGKTADFPYNFNVANLLLSFYKVNPAFTGCIMTVQRAFDGETKDIYFYNNYINVANIQQFAKSGEVFVTEWKDQSLNKNNYVPDIADRPRILTSNGVFDSGIHFDRSLLKTNNPLGFIDGAGYTIEFSGGNVGYSGGSYYNPSIDIGNLNVGWQIDFSDEVTSVSKGKNLVIPTVVFDTSLFIDAITTDKKIFLGTKLSDIHIFPFNTDIRGGSNFLFDTTTGAYTPDTFPFSLDIDAECESILVKNEDSDSEVVGNPQTTADIIFELNGDGTEYIVKKCSTNLVGDVVIYSTHLDTTQSASTLPVTVIGVAAFLNCSNITSVTLPNSLTSIEGSAFLNCAGLTSITIPNNVTSIGDSAFGGCSGLTSVTIPDSVTSIGDFAFRNCTSLTSITVPDSMTQIRDGVFKNCTNLASITIPDSVFLIGDHAFSSCDSLTSIIIPDSVTLIGDHAFSSCDSLTSIIIPDGVTRINVSTFNGCGSLTSITIPEGVTRIRAGAFNGCRSITSITIPSTVNQIDFSAFANLDSATALIFLGTEAPNLKTLPDGEQFINGVLISAFGSVENPDNPSIIVQVPDGVDSAGIPIYESYISKAKGGDGVSKYGGLEVQVQASLNSLTFLLNSTGTGYIMHRCDPIAVGSITIPSTFNGLPVTELSNIAFYLCTNITSVTIPDSVTEIRDGAFYQASGLTSVNIPDGVTYIRDFTFWECSSLDNITISNNVTSIGRLAFADCTSLSNITIGNSVTLIDDRAFLKCTSLASITLPDSVVTIGRSLLTAASVFAGCSSLTSINIPDGVRTIQAGTFSNCTSLTSVTIPDSVTLIGRLAFNTCTSLTSVTIGNSVTTIDQSAFSNCTSLDNITLPDNLRQINESAFAGCSSLTSITIPDSVSSIKQSAFRNCISLATITILGLRAPSLLKTVNAGYEVDQRETSVFADVGTRFVNMQVGVTNIDEGGVFYGSLQIVYV